MQSTGGSISSRSLPDQAISQAESSAQFETAGFLRDERVGAVFKQKAVTLLGLDGPAQPGAGLEKLNPDGTVVPLGPLDKPVRSRQAGDPAADDGHGWRQTL